MLTPFGKLIRQYRNDKGLRLLDLAQRLELSPAFVSGVETGRKSIPDGYVTAVTRALNLTAAESRALRHASDRTRKDVRVDHLSPEQRELVAAFARKPNAVPDDVIVKLRRALLKSVSNEVPFHRTRRGIIVPPMSSEALREHAERVRTACVPDDATIEFPIIDALEYTLVKVFPDFCFDVVEKELMGEDEGYVLAGGTSLALREDVYIGACKGSGRDRFTACHELAHFLLHREVTIARAREDDVAVFRDSEWQADSFAGALLMSARHLPKFSSSHAAAVHCGMTEHAAEVQWSKYKKWGLIKDKK